MYIPESLALLKKKKQISIVTYESSFKNNLKIDIKYSKIMLTIISTAFIKIVNDNIQ